MITYIDKKVPVSALRHHEGAFDMRSEDNSAEEKAKLEELAASIKANGGLIEPLIVTNGQQEKGEPVYFVRAGGRRFRALKLLRLRGDVPVRVVEGASPGELALLNLEENLLREQPHLADVARRYWELLNGAYYEAPAAPEGEESTGKVPIERVCQGTNKSRKYVQNLARVWGALSDEVRVAWRRFDIPLGDVTPWAAEKDPEAQKKLCDRWVIKHANTPRGERRKKAKRGEDARDKATPRPRSEVTAKLEKLVAKKESGPTLRGAELEVLEARITTLRWALGLVQRWS